MIPETPEPSAERPSAVPSCVLIGADTLLIQCGELLRSAGWAIRRVVSRNGEILDWAHQAGLETAPTGRDLEARLSDVDFDYLFSITNLSILPEGLLALARRAAINFHDGPLPAYAGMYTPAWAILNGEREYGITFHEMTPGVDEGRLLVQRRFPIDDDATSLTLNTACYAAAIEAFRELIDGLAAGGVTPLEQDLTERSYFGRFDRPGAAGVIDWQRPAEDVSRWVRALEFGDRYPNPFAVAKVVHAGRVARVRGAVPCEAEGAGAPGTLLAVDDAGWEVRCGEGAVRLTGLGCPRGRAWSGPEAAEALGLRVGDTLSGVPDRALLDEEVARTVRSEAAWVRRLAALDPVEAPYRQEPARGAEGPAVDPTSEDRAGRVACLPLSMDGAAAFGEGPERALGVVAGFALYLSRIMGSDAFDLTWSEDALDARVAPHGELFSRFVPWRVELDRGASSGAALDAVREGLETTRERGTFLVDTIARDPALAGHPLLAAGRWTSVAAGLHAEAGPEVLPEGTDLALRVDPESGAGRLVYDPEALEPASVEAIRDQLDVFLASLAERDRGLASLPLLDEAERRRILYEWNRTEVDYDRRATVASLFAAQVERTPEAPACSFEGETLSYRELDDRAGRLAAHLRGLGIGPDVLVGLHLARSIDMLVGVLGVLKAGGAYVPLDPVYPAERIAYMIEDSRASVVLTHAAAGAPPPAAGARVVDLDRDAEAIAASAAPSEGDGDPASACDLAYVIYTSGSTGKPKGVMVEHRNAVNFFVGMDERIPHDPPGRWLAVTSLSFDISILELLWTLTRGFEVVVFADRERVMAGADAGERQRPWRPLDMGLALWGSDAGPGPRKYELMLESAKFADAHGFCAVHTPERHFGAFGGPFPNPSVTGAAIAAVTKRVQIRASSCVLPLHHPIRVAEEWAVVDNISNGRVGVSFASGWQPNDFVIRPEAFADAKKAMFENADIVRKLWRGESVEFENPHGKRVPTATLPRPVQEDLPTWITTAGNVDTFRAAGAAGFNVLTHLLGQTLDELAEKVKAYRQAAADAGRDPNAGTVTCMLHTFVGDDDAEVRRIVREPMKEYLASSMKLVVDFAWSFPAFERPGGPDSKPEDVDLKSLSPDETDAILEFAFERYYETSGLMGTPEACEAMLERCKDADIDEIACLIDFGVDTDVVLSSLDALDGLRRRVNERPADAPVVARDAEVEAGHGFAAQVERHAITHLQCTPSHATMLLANPETRAALGRIPNLMIGGEAFPVSLAAELDAAVSGRVTNMYGPTETTIWSSTQPVEGRPDAISIGRPIANTALYVLDAGLEPLPVGVAGELWIGGEGVVRGYHERPELTDERFVPDPFSDRPGARMYRTGDLARWTGDGRIDFLGRLDHQVKIRGYRIELGEIEARLAAREGIRECVVIAREDTPGDVRLVAYAIAEGSAQDGAPEVSALRDALRETLPEFMVPAEIVFLERFPMTPNGKVDRKALPAPRDVQRKRQAEYVAPANELEGQIASVWREVLYLEQVGVHDNFFDLGGHSLLVVQAHRKLVDVVPMPITLTDLYRFPTISGLAEHLSSGDGGAAAAAASQARGEKRRKALGRRRRRGGPA